MSTVPSPKGGSSPSSLRRLRAPVLVAVVAAIGAVWLARPGDVLVEHVVFEGNARASDATLRHLVDVRNGTTMFAVDLERAVEGAQQHPWVRSADARRRFPDTVVVTVDEFEPVALLHRDGLSYVDRTGVVFLRARADDLDYPVITGVDEALARSHPDLPRLVVRDALWLLDALDTRGLAPRPRVSEVAFSRTRGFTVHLVSGAELRFGLEGLERQVDRLDRLRQEGVDLETPVLVDLAPASVAIVRPNTGAASTSPTPASTGTSPGGEG